MHAGNHRARTKEEQCLEERMRNDVKDRGDERANATSQKHVSKLRDRRVGQHFLDVVLCEADRCRKQRRHGSYNRHNEHCHRCMHEDRIAANDHVNARCHHGRGVNQSRDRRWSGHGIGQPNVEWDLCAFSSRANEKQYCHRSDATSKERMPGKWIGGQVANRLQGVT